MTLTEFLLARIAEDEEVAREATNDGHRWLVEDEAIGLWPDDLEPATGYMHFPRKAHAYHAATWNPDRVRDECEAKRRIMELHYDGAGNLYGPDTHFCAVCTSADGLDDPGWPCPTLRALALPYSSHPEYDETWRP